MDIIKDAQIKNVVNAFCKLIDKNPNCDFGNNLHLKQVPNYIERKEMQFSPFIIDDDEGGNEFRRFKQGELQKTRGSIYLFFDDLSKNVDVIRALYPDRIKQFTTWLGELGVPSTDQNLFAFSLLHELGHWDFFCGMMNNTQEFQDHKTKYLRVHEDYADLYAYKYMKELVALMNDIYK